ncbi:tenascin-X [Pyxidicoccus xibeiensis]|uniref:tenascin-X n=1 Tax=Pyxidicoccus xibeiensis TaxID=2906759 RepID=UPI0020A74D9C|nr:tenascin-X [Pyxidicoccus xibeiensis]MCP3137072.1 tenascin-X [Pyxidicoccus xibeiensis]
MARATTAGGVGRAVILLALVLGVGTGCPGEPPLKNAVGRLRLSQERVDFPVAYPGTTRAAEVRVVNAGRAPLDVTWTAVPEPFSLVDALPARVQTGEVPVRLRFSPQAVGTYEVTVTGTSSDGGEVALVLVAEAKPIPDCFTPVTCATATFDVATEQCVETLLPDGTACDPGNSCLIGATCQAGRCRGTERACDDGNACTTDVCHALDGCTSVPAPPCPGDGKCQVGTCDPKKGCGLAPAKDGTFCGTARGCDDADVCVEGDCVRRNLPDGFLCAQASPCQGEGVCRGPVCERPAAVPLTMDWSYDARSRDNLHDMLVGPEGDVTLSGFYGTPVLNAASASPVRSNAAGRRCMLWNDRLLCMDLPRDGTVSLLERATGAPRWTFTLSEARPDIAGRTLTLFLARLAVMAPDRLAALFEAYPAGQSRDTLCRMYFLVVLDAFGKMVSAQELTDPLLSECNHPHPFGLASDAAGDLYVSFARSMNSGAPLQAGSPTLLMAFSSDGVPRWRKNEPFRSGELAVANGLLLPEFGTQALKTADGSPAGAIPQAFGRAVATRTVAVPSAPGTTVNWSSSLSSTPAATELKGFKLPGLDPLWTYSLKAGQLLTTKELRLASLPVGAGLPPETVVLTTAADTSGEKTEWLLVGVRPGDGSEAFQCPMSYEARTFPQLLELAPGALMVMDGAERCGECDPPFANSQARFMRFVTPGLLPAKEPWPGTFGGPGHGHHETAAH